MEDGKQLIDNTVIGILERLSVKSLVRFKCVSKYWFAFLKSPSFMNSHLRKAQMKDGMMLVRFHLRAEDADVLSFLDLNSLEKVWPNLPIPIFKDLKLKTGRPYGYKSVYLLGPSLGLICILYGECILLCNPALQEFKQLPPCPLSCPNDYYTRSLGHGFGHTSTNDFKVVWINLLWPDDYVGDDNIFSVHVYNSRTNSWTQFRDENISMPYVIHYPCAELFFKGACHWNADSSGSLRYMNIVLSFDLSTEVFTQIEYPDCLKRLDGYRPYLLVIKDCLALFRFQYNKLKPVEVWVMKEYGIKESWIKQFVIGPHIVRCAFFAWKNDECSVAETTDGQLVSFAFGSNATERLPINGSEETFRCLIYKESLISLHKLQEGNVL